MAGVILSQFKSCATICAECKLPEIQEPTGEAYLAAASAVLPYLIGHRSRLQAFEAPGSPRKPAQPVLENSTSLSLSEEEDAGTQTNVCADPLLDNICHCQNLNVICLTLCPHACLSDLIVLQVLC